MYNLCIFDCKPTVITVHIIIVLHKMCAPLSSEYERKHTKCPGGS